MSKLMESELFHAKEYGTALDMVKAYSKIIGIEQALVQIDDYDHEWAKAYRLLELYKQEGKTAIKELRNMV